MRYRRSTTPGATYFFTVVTYRRRVMLCELDAVVLLRNVFATVKKSRIARRQPGRSGTGRARHSLHPLNPSGNAALLPDLPGNWPMRYRRSTTPGATYFFTVVTYRRRVMLCELDAVTLLREAV